MGKITVKHFLNVDLKSISQLYPIYTQVTYKRKVYKFKTTSLPFEYANDEILNIISNTDIIAKDIRNIERTIKILEENNIPITSANLSKYIKPFFKVLEENFCKLVSKEIKDAPPFFAKSGYLEILELLEFLGDESYKAFFGISEKIRLLEEIIKGLDVVSILRYDELFAIDFYGGDKYQTIRESISITEDLFKNKETEQKNIDEIIFLLRDFIDL